MFVVGIPSYDRPRPLEITLRSLVCVKHVEGIVVVADASSYNAFSKYKSILSVMRKQINNLVYEIKLGRRGSANARNTTLKLALQHFSKATAFVTLEDDCLVPSENWLSPIIKWFEKPDVGIVGGTRINLRRRQKDPEFYLNAMPYLAEILTKLTGFIFLNTKHGPRYTIYTTHLMAIRMKLIREGLRYDPNYGGTGYREESDIQEQVRRLGYKIIQDPSFYVYHLGLEIGGDYATGTPLRFYWKARNNIYFIRKHGLGVHKLIASTAIIAAYSALHGWGALRATARAVREALTDAKLGRGTLSPLK